MKKTFGIFILLLLSAVGSSQQEKIKTMVSDYTNDLIKLRNEYKLKLNEIDPNSTIIGIQMVKDMERLIIAKNSIKKQKQIDNWHFANSINLYENWKTKFENEIKDDYPDVYQAFFELYSASYEKIASLILIENKYLDKYEEFINFIILNNDNILIINGELSMTSQNLIDMYISLANDLAINENQYYSFIENWKADRIRKISKINETLKISNIDIILDDFK
jgi:hypothetical protein